MTVFKKCIISMFSENKSTMCTARPDNFNIVVILKHLSCPNFTIIGAYDSALQLHI